MEYHSRMHPKADLETSAVHHYTHPRSCSAQAASHRQASLQRAEEQRKQEAREAQLRAGQQAQAAELAAIRCLLFSPSPMMT
jgi:hypothetical protein